MELVTEEFIQGKNEEVEKPSITVEELDVLVEQRFIKKAEVDEKEKEKKVLSKELIAIDAQLSSALVELKRDNYKTEDGSVRLQEEWYVSVPKDQEKRDQLFDWLKEQDIFEKYITINGTSLKALFKAERQAALDRGADMMTWSIPGLADARMHRVLRGTKGKGK